MCMTLELSSCNTSETWMYYENWILDNPGEFFGHIQMWTMIELSMHIEDHNPLLII